MVVMALVFSALFQRRIGPNGEAAIKIQRTVIADTGGATGGEGGGYAILYHVYLSNTSTMALSTGRCTLDGKLSTAEGTTVCNESTNERMAFYT